MSLFYVSAVKALAVILLSYIVVLPHDMCCFISAICSWLPILLKLPTQSFLFLKTFSDFQSSLHMILCPKSFLISQAWTSFSLICSTDKFLLQYNNNMTPFSYHHYYIFIYINSIHHIISSPQRVKWCPDSLSIELIVSCVPVFVSFFSHRCEKIPHKSNLQNEGFLLTHSPLNSHHSIFRPS